MARDHKHYKKMFEGTDTVGTELLAKAIHTVKTGEDERPPSELIRALKKLHGGNVESQTALMLLADAAASLEAAPNIGATLRARRDELGLTRGDVEALTGLHVNTIKGAENDGGNPTLSTLRALAGALGLDLAELVGGER